MTSVLSYNAAFTAHTKPTTGDIKSSFVSVDHLGWLRCDGRYLSTVTYNLLFQVIGYTYGSSEAGAKFRLPNMSGRVIGSEGTIVEPSDTYVFPSGTVTGEVEHQLLVAEMPAHNHDITTPTVAPPADGNTSIVQTGITVNFNTTGITTADHTHEYQDAYFAENHSVSPPIFPAPPTVFGTNADTDDDNHYYFRDKNGNSSGLPIPQGNMPLTEASNVTIVEPTISAVPLIQGHNHTITDLGHRHQIKPNGGDQYHNNMQPTIFYGNTFVYCGIPTTTNLVQARPDWQNSWPYAVPQSNPPLL
jgi:microcystin-dependent protein